MSDDGEPDPRDVFMAVVVMVCGAGCGVVVALAILAHCGGGR